MNKLDGNQAPVVDTLNLKNQKSSEDKILESPLFEMARWRGDIDVELLD